MLEKLTRASEEQKKGKSTRSLTPVDDGTYETMESQSFTKASPCPLWKAPSMCKEHTRLRECDWHQFIPRMVHDPEVHAQKYIQKQENVIEEFRECGLYVHLGTLWSWKNGSLWNLWSRNFDLWIWNKRYSLCSKQSAARSRGEKYICTI